MSLNFSKQAKKSLTKLDVALHDAVEKLTTPLQTIADGAPVNTAFEKSAELQTILHRGERLLSVRATEKYRLLFTVTVVRAPVRSVEVANIVPSDKQ